MNNNKCIILWEFYSFFTNSYTRVVTRKKLVIETGDLHTIVERNFRFAYKFCPTQWCLLRFKCALEKTITAYPGPAHAELPFLSMGFSSTLNGHRIGHMWMSLSQLCSLNSNKLFLYQIFWSLNMHKAICLSWVSKISLENSWEDMWVCYLAIVNSNIKKGQHAFIVSRGKV